MWLVAAGVHVEAAFIVDWHEGDISPSAATAAAIKFEMRELQKKGLILLFLDIDGVLRPFERRSEPELPYLPRLERALRNFPTVRLVISSTQRETTEFETICGWFSPDIADRVIGCTPIHVLNSAQDLAESRYREILAYLNCADVKWLALDDDASLFPLNCPQLIQCADGFQEHEELVLCKKLSF